MYVTVMVLLQVVFSATTVLSMVTKIRQCHNLCPMVIIYLIHQSIGYILLILRGQKKTLISVGILTCQIHLFYKLCFCKMEIYLLVTM